MIEQETLTNPFPGLRPFEANEEHLFFGRDGQSDELLRRLRRSRFLAVLGSSGSGKSSLVRAGLLPSLYGGIMTHAGSRWRVALFRPGHDPIGNLAHALNSSEVFGDAAEETGLQQTIIEATLRRSALGLVEAARQARMSVNENLLVVADQFEEIFRFRRTRKEGSEDEAAAFVKLLLEAKYQTEVPIYIVITMRSDFLGDCSQFRDLPEAINDGQYLIPRMTRDQRREAIMGPVAVGGGEMSPVLVNRLLNDVGDNPDQLPILQHALMRTWDYWAHHRRDGQPIELRDYEAVGTMTEALSRHADEAYNELPNDRSRKVAEKLFKSLTEKGPDNREIRRPTRVNEICAIAEASEAEVIAVIERFRLHGRSFLMPPADVPLGPESLIDISHESLIRGWERLREWVNEEARSAQIYRRLAETAALHQEGRAALWHDPDLALALHWREENRPNAVWAQHYHPDFDGAMAFLTSSKEAAEAEIAAKEAQRRREIRRTRLFSMVLGVAFLISVGFGAFAYDARNKAYAARNEALEQRNKADASRNDAVVASQRAEEEKQRAQKSEERALKSEEEAQTEKENAERAAEIAEQRRKEAQAATERAHQAQLVADEKRREAVRAALESDQAAVRVRRQNLSDMQNVITIVDRLIELSTPEEAAYWRSYRANAFTELGRHDLSKEESTKVLDVFGDNLSARINRGYMSLILFQPEDALKDFQRAKELDPHSALGYLNLGVAQANVKEYESAAESLRLAIQWYRPLYFENVFDSEVSPEIKRATHRTVITADGNALNNAMHYELASLEAFRGGKDFESLLAEADRHAEQTSSSIEGYLTAINWAWYQLRKIPEDYGAWAAQAHLWRKAGHDDWAKYCFLRFQCDHQKLKDPRYDGIARWVTRQLKTLPADLPAVDCSTPPDSQLDTRSRIFEAEELASIGKFNEALDLLDEGLQIQPNNIEMLLSRARYRKWNGDREPENSAGRKHFWEGSQQDFATAFKLAETEVGYKPYISLLWAYFGKAMGAIDDKQRQAYFQQALELGPVSADALSELSDLIAKDDPLGALDLLERSLKLEPSAKSYYKLAKLQNDTRRYKEALGSVKLALSLRDSTSGYYEERERAYKERERAEEGLGVGEIERKRRLAAGFTEIGDTLLRRLDTEQANRAYQESKRILTDLSRLGKNESVASDLVVVNSKLSHLLEVTRTTTTLEPASCAIIAIKDGAGSTREVTIDRGSEDGITRGATGNVYSAYSKDGEHERTVRTIAQATVISAASQSAVVEITMENPSADGLVRVGDLVEVMAKVPPLPDRSVLWRLAKYHIRFTSEDGTRVHTDYRRLYAQENPELVGQILDAMISDIRETAKLLGGSELMSQALSEGRFKGKTLREAMDNPTRGDIVDFLNYIMKYPRDYYGKDVKIGRLWGTWALSGTPQ